MKQDERKRLTAQVQRRQKKINKLKSQLAEFDDIKEEFKQLEEAHAKLQNKHKWVEVRKVLQLEEIKLWKERYQNEKLTALKVTPEVRDPKNVVVQTTDKGRIIKFCHGVDGTGRPRITAYPIAEIKGL